MSTQEHGPVGDSFYERLAQHAGLEFVELEPVGGVEPISPQAAQLVPESVCRQYEVIPLRLHGDVMVIAMAQPFDDAGRHAVTRLVDRRIQVSVASPSDIKDAIDRVYPGITPLAAAADAAAPAVDADAEPAEEIEEPDPRPDMRMLPRPEQRRIGELLMERGFLDYDELAVALETQQETGSFLGEVVHHDGLVDAYEVASVLAEQARLPLIDLSTIEVDPDAVDQVPEPVSRALGAVPLAIDGDEMHVVFSDPPREETYAALAEHTSLRVRPYLAPPSAVDLLLQQLHSTEYVRDARTKLLTSFPEDCANRVLSGGQKVFFILLVLAIFVFGVIDPITVGVVLVGFSTVFYLLVSLYKFKLVYSSLNGPNEIVVSAKEISDLDERDLPVYTILVPLFREAEVVPRLAEHINDLDYPRSKLDVRLLVEEEDDETYDAIMAQNLLPHFKVVVVPDAQPKTKPKACNYGMLQAEGKYVVIYDAEDRPDPAQLKKAVIAFSEVGPDIACVQAVLNYFNQEQNLLTRWFSTEYAMWFDLLLPGLSASKTPIPLGGTSNHFIRQRLIDLGGWDPFNVTEDADLGIRLHKAGYSTAMLDSTTLEEANSDLGNWIRQRSRWIKGYIQTYLVHMRHPFRLFRQIGPRAFFSFQAVIGGTAIFLLNPIFWLLTTVWILTEAGAIEQMFPGVLYYAAAFQLFIGNFVFMYLNVAGSLHRHYYRLAKYALFTPLYWGLMSIAAWKGFLQLFYRPFYWEKTVHGLDVAEPAAAEPAPAAAAAS